MVLDNGSFIHSAFVNYMISVFYVSFYLAFFLSFLFLASHIHKYMAQVVQLKQEVLTVRHVMLSVAVLFLTF